MTEELVYVEEIEPQTEANELDPSSVVVGAFLGVGGFLLGRELVRNVAELVRLKIDDAKAGLPSYGEDNRFVVQMADGSTRTMRVEQNADGTFVIEYEDEEKE